MDAVAIAEAVGWHRGARRAIAIPGSESAVCWYDAAGRFQAYAIDDVFANWKAFRPTWGEPRPVDEWLWMDLDIFDCDDCLLRSGRVWWNTDGTGHFHISITIDNYGFMCWPDFHALSDAQDYVEHLMALPLETVKGLNGAQWPGVVV